MNDKTSPPHHMMLYAGGVTLSVLLALYYWQATSFAEAVQDLLPTRIVIDTLSPTFTASISLIMPALLVGTALCVIWPFARAHTTRLPSGNEHSALKHFLQAYRCSPTVVYTAIVMGLICCYNLLLLTAPYSVLDYATNLIKAVYPLVSIWGLIVTVVTGIIFDLYAVTQVRPAAILSILTLFIAAVLFLNGFSTSMRHNDTMPYELAYLIVSKIPMIVGMAIITDLFRRIGKCAGYLGVGLSSLIIVLLSSSLVSTDAIALLACCAIFGTLRATGSSLCFILGMHAFSQIIAYLMFKGCYSLQYTPMQFHHPFLYAT